MEFYLKDFSIFISISETKSLSKTASLMGMSVSSVSKRLTRLEDYLQTTLFERTTRNLKLSPMGEVAYRKSLFITSEFQNFISDLKSSSFKIKVHSNKGEHESHLIDWCYQYCQDINKVDISVNSNKKSIESIDMDDLFITHQRSNYSLAIHRNLHPVKRTICCSANLMTERKITSPEDLLNNNTIYFSTNEKDNKVTLNNGNETIELGSGGLHISSVEDALKMVVEKDCVLVGIPEVYVRELIRQGKVVQILQDWEMDALNFYLVWKDRPFFNKEFSNFLEFIENKWQEKYNVNQLLN